MATMADGSSSGNRGAAGTPLAPPTLAGNDSFAISLALLLIRLVLGWTFIYHGSQKLFGAFGGIGGLGAVEGMKAFSGYLQDMPVLPPLVWGYMAACGEFFGGVSILLGLLARLGAIPILVTMSVAIWKMTGKSGFSNPLGYEFNLALIAMAAAVLIAGPGLISIDALLFKRSLWSRGPQPLSQPGVRQQTLKA